MVSLAANYYLQRLSQPPTLGNMLPFPSTFPTNPNLPIATPLINVHNNLPSYPYLMSNTLPPTPSMPISTPTIPVTPATAGILMLNTPGHVHSAQLSVPTVTDQEHTVKKQRLIKQEKVPPPPSMQTANNGHNRRWSVYLCDRANDKQKQVEETNEFATHF